MSENYGLEIINTDGRVQIDANFSGVFVNSTGTASRGAAFPPTGFDASKGDVVACRATSNGYVARAYDDETDNRAEFGDTRTSKTIYDDAPTFQFKILRPFAGNVTAGTSAYGLEVYKADGDIAYSTGKEDFVRIATLGTLGGDAVLRYPPTGTIDLSKHFILMGTGIGHTYFEFEITFELGTFLQSYEFMAGYEYVYTSGNNGHINITNKYLFNGISQSADVVGDMQYTIFEVID